MNQSQPMQLLTSKKHVNWYTPPKYIEMARQVMGSIDLDPASCDVAQSWIKAKRYYGDSGLYAPWYGNVWFNPPFDNTALWINTFYAWLNKDIINQAMVLVNSNHGYNWYEELWRKFPVCCARERIEFLTDYDIGECKYGNGKQVLVGDQTLMVKGQAKRGQTFVYYGPNIETFIKLFTPIGRVIIPKKAS